MELREGRKGGREGGKQKGEKKEGRKGRKRRERWRERGRSRHRQPSCLPGERICTSLVSLDFIFSKRRDDEGIVCKALKGKHLGDDGDQCCDCKIKSQKRRVGIPAFLPALRYSPTRGPSEQRVLCGTLPTPHSLPRNGSH